MPVIGHRDHDRVDVMPRHHFPVVVVGLDHLFLVKFIDDIDRLGQVQLVNIAGGDNLHVLELHEFIRVARRLHAPPHHPHGNALRRGWPPVPAQRRGGNERWKRQGRARRSCHFKKTPTAQTSLRLNCFCHITYFVPPSRATPEKSFFPLARRRPAGRFRPCLFASFFSAPAPPRACP